MNGRPFPGPAGPLLQPWRGTAEALLEAANRQAPLWWVRGSRMRTKAGLMDEWAAAAQFPPHFGGTWDALRDALADLPEGGTFLVLEAEQLLQDAPPEDFITLVDGAARSQGRSGPPALPAGPSGASRSTTTPSSKDCGPWAWD